MKKVVHNQGSEPWKAWRRRGLGGSDIAAILGISPYPDGTRENVFREKVHGWERPQNGAMYRGTVLEPHARAAYSERVRCSAPPCCVEMDSYPWARVSLDGLPNNGAIIPSERDEWILELKCPGWETHDLALEGVVARHFDVQIQWQLLVCGLTRCDFASFNPSERFTPQGFPALAKWKALPTSRENPRPSLLHVWAAERVRPPMPPEWLAVLPVAPDALVQAWIMEEAARFWFEVEEARAALPKAPEKDRSKIEAEFA